MCLIREPELVIKGCGEMITRRWVGHVYKEVSLTYEFV